MRLRNLALGLTAVGLLAVGTAAPSPAAEVKKFEGTISAPLPVAGSLLAGSYEGVDQARMVCPGPGDFDGVFYKFFELKGDYNHFFVSGPALLVDTADPTGTVLSGAIHDYDLDLYLFDAKCNEMETTGHSINYGNGVGFATTKKPARFAAVTYFSGTHADIPVLLEASTEKIKK